MKPKPETQLEFATRIVKRIADGRPHKADLMVLDDVLDRSQNRPPLGKSDGTIDAALWRDLMLLYKALSATIANLNGLEKRLKWNSGGSSGK